MTIRLRAIERKDLELLKSWRNSEIIQPFVREYRLLSSEDQEEWFESYRKQRKDSDWGQELMIISEKTDKRVLNFYEGASSKIEYFYEDIGVGGFVRIEWRNRRAEFSFYSINRDKKEAILEILKKGFHDFNFHKITWPVYSHDPNLCVYRSIFREEATLKEEYFWNGSFQDRHYLSINKQEFDKLSIL